MGPGYTRKTLSYQQCLRSSKLIHSWDIICCNSAMIVVLRPPRDGPSHNVDRMGARVGPLADLYQRKEYDRRWRELLLTCFRSRHVAPKLYEGAASIEYEGAPMFSKGETIQFRHDMEVIGHHAAKWVPFWQRMYDWLLDSRACFAPSWYLNILNSFSLYSHILYWNIHIFLNFYQYIQICLKIIKYHRCWSKTCKRCFKLTVSPRKGDGGDCGFDQEHVDLLGVLLGTRHNGDC